MDSATVFVLIVGVYYKMTAQIKILEKMIRFAFIKQENYEQS